MPVEFISLAETCCIHYYTVHTTPHSETFTLEIYIHMNGTKRRSHLNFYLYFREVTTCALSGSRLMLTYSPLVEIRQRWRTTDEYMHSFQQTYSMARPRPIEPGKNIYIFYCARIDTEEKKGDFFGIFFNGLGHISTETVSIWFSNAVFWHPTYLLFFSHE